MMVESPCSKEPSTIILNQYERISIYFLRYLKLKKTKNHGIIFYYSRQKTDEQKRERANERQKQVDEQKIEAQIIRERASKLRDFKQYMFGEPICE